MNINSLEQLLENSGQKQRDKHTAVATPKGLQSLLHESRKRTQRNKALAFGTGTLAVILIAGIGLVARPDKTPETNIYATGTTELPQESIPVTSPTVLETRPDEHAPSTVPVVTTIPITVESTAIPPVSTIVIPEPSTTEPESPTYPSEIIFTTDEILSTVPYFVVPDDLDGDQCDGHYRYIEFSSDNVRPHYAYSPGSQLYSSYSPGLLGIPNRNLTVLQPIRSQQEDEQLSCFIHDVQSHNVGSSFIFMIDTASGLSVTKYRIENNGIFGYTLNQKIPGDIHYDYYPHSLPSEYNLQDYTKTVSCHEFSVGKLFALPLEDWPSLVKNNENYSDRILMLENDCKTLSK